MGTMIGEMSTAITRLLPGNSARVSPSAAIVPSAVASAVEQIAITTLLTIERCHRSDCGESPKISSYHRIEKPSMGYVKKGTELNDSGMITTIGAIRKKKIRPQTTRSA